MKLNYNSVSARLYRWFYGTSEMPESLCPYFWKLAIMWLLILPYWVISLPTLLTSNYNDTKTVERFFIGVLSYLALFVIFIGLFPITYFFYGWFEKGTTLQSWQLSGILVDIAIIIVLITIGITVLITKRKEYKHGISKEYIWDYATSTHIKNPKYKPKRPNILIEFIKASYNKYCPKITWDN